MYKPSMSRMIKWALGGTGSDSRMLINSIEFLKYDVTFLVEARAASLGMLKHVVSGH